MRKIFITGATGYIGGSVAHLLINKGYDVTALVRKEADAKKLEELGMRTVIGSTQNVHLLKAEAIKADAVISTADADDVYAVAAFLEALKGTGRTFIHTSGSSLVGDDARGTASAVIYDETTPLQPKLQKAQRVLMNDTIVKAAQDHIRTIVIVPTMIYGDGLGIKKDSIQVPMMAELARERGAGMHIEAGENIWSNVHIADLAELYLLALEKAPAGAYYYAENGESALKDIAVSISKKEGFRGKVDSLPLAEAIELWGPDGAAFGLASNSRVNADKARQELGWKPVHTSITADIEKESLA